jgi:hypothetical protein
MDPLRVLASLLQTPATKKLTEKTANAIIKGITKGITKSKPGPRPPFGIK